MYSVDSDHESGEEEDMQLDILFGGPEAEDNPDVEAYWADRDNSERSGSGLVTPQNNSSASHSHADDGEPGPAPAAIASYAGPLSARVSDRVAADQSDRPEPGVRRTRKKRKRSPGTSKRRRYRP